MFNVVGLLYTIAFMVFLHWAVDRYEYLPCVGLYAIGRGLIPALIPFSGPIIILAETVLRFIIGFLFVKIFARITQDLNDYRVVIAVGAVIEYVITFGLAFLLASVLYTLS